MNESARKWVAALRSGRYAQGRSVLRRVGTDEFCCLGVACDLAVDAGVIPPPEQSDGAYGYGVGHERDHIVLPPSVARWLGLRTHGGDYGGTDLAAECLAADNDNGMSFRRVADLIESEPEGLFA